MQPVPRTLPENFSALYEWVRRLDRRTARIQRPRDLRAGGRLGPSVAVVDDLDDATETGWYQGDSGTTANVPTTDYSSWFINVVQVASGQVTQEAWPHYSHLARYVRRRTVSGSWSGWQVMQRERISTTLGNGAFQGTGVTLGNGTATRDEWIADGVVHQVLTITCGSTTDITGELGVYCGWGTIAGGLLIPSGSGRYLRSGRHFDLSVFVDNNVAFIRFNQAGNGGWVEHIPAGTISGWNAGSVLSAHWSFPIS